MKEQKDIDQLFESLMRNNDVEDNGFSEKIVAEISSRPRLAFIATIYPMLGGFFGLIIFLLTRQSFASVDLSFFGRSAILMNHELSRAASLYANYGSYMLMATLSLIAMYFILQPEKN